MKEKNFLIKVIGLSGVPRIFSFIFTLFSFPLMLKNIGASQYGIIVYLTSIIAIVESLADFGVSSAAGKEIASARALRPTTLIQEILAWGKFQITASLIGLIPMALVTFFILHSTKGFNISSTIVILSLAASWVTIMTNFVRSILTATLSFKSLAILDTLESLIRSASFLVVAFIMPNALGLALAFFFVGIFISISAFIILRITLKKYSKINDYNHHQMPLNKKGYKEMIKESLSFLWLRLATRCFLGLPIFIIGIQFNSTIVGIIGTMQRIVDLLTFPFAVIGNALSVRAKELIVIGDVALNSVWDVIFRLKSIAVLLWLTVLISSRLFSNLLFNQYEPDPLIFAILTITILTTSTSILVNPLTDYVGALKKRNVLLSIVSIIQVPFLWFSGYYFGIIGSISAYVIILLFINFGYLRISMKAFFPDKRYQIKSEFKIFISYSLFLALFITLIKYIIPQIESFDLTNDSINIFAISVFIFFMLIFMIFNNKLRRFYLTKHFFEFYSE
jgi:O-antigen/teichoic acid export membrane protein